MILDTGAISAWADGQSGIQHLLATTQRLVLPVIALGEYLFGILQSRERSRYEAWLTANLPTVEIAVVGRQTAREYAEIRLELKQRGAPIPVNDTWIAALARQHQLPILSKDTHFDRVPGIQRLGW